MKTYDIRYLPEGKTYKNIYLNRGKSKMKKVLTIGLMLLVCAGFVFAADQEKDTLTVTVDVQGTTTVEWLTVKPGTDEFNWEENDDKLSTEESTLEVGRDYTYYPAVKTNEASMTELKISATPLKSDAGDYIKYTVKPVEESEGNLSIKTGTYDSEITIDEGTNNSDDGTEIITYSDNSNNAGMRTLFGQVVIKVDEASYNAASSGTYTATLTLTTNVTV